MKTLKCILYWIISFTWGILASVIGACAALVCLITKHKPHIYGYSVYFNFGENWGGFSCGPFLFGSPESWTNIRQHEHGHGLQNLVLGPFWPFLVGIPSMLRYWLRTFETSSKRVLYVILVTIIPLLLLSVGIVCGFVFGILWLGILCSVAAAYVLGVCLIWQLIELPSYKTKPWPTYDSVWFEGSATSLGKKYFN